MRLHIVPRMLLAVAALVLAGVQPSLARAMPEPSGPVVLSVSGSVASRNSPATADFDLAMLECLPVVEVATATLWDEGVQQFQGVLMSTLLKRIGATGTVLQATALNNYRIEIPLADFEHYPVVLAFRKNGKPMRVRDKGPLWIVYPLDQHPELMTDATYGKMIWQLRALDVK